MLPNPWTKEQDAIAIKMAEAGFPLAKIGERVGRSADGVRSRLKRHLRPDLTVSKVERGDGPARTAAPWLTTEDETVMRVLRDGGTIIDAGLIVGRSPESVRKRLKALRSALIPSTTNRTLARDRPIPPRQMRGSEEQGRKLHHDAVRASRLHLIDLMRSFDADTLGEAKARYCSRHEYTAQAGTPVYMPLPVLALSYVGSTAAMCSGD